MGKKGKALTMKELKKKVGAGKENSAKDARKASVRGAKRGRAKIERDHNPLAEVKLVHPKSRRAKQLMRSFGNDLKKQEHAEKQEVVAGLLARKVRFVQEYMKRPDQLATFEEVKCVPLAVLQQLVIAYIQRHDAEISELKEKRAATHYRAMQPSGRENELVALREQEELAAKNEEMEMPMLTSKKGMAAVRAWNGTDHGALNNMQMTKVSVKEAPFEHNTFSMGERVSYSRLAKLKVKMAARKVKTRGSKAVDAVETKKERQDVSGAAVATLHQQKLQEARGIKVDAGAEGQPKKKAAVRRVVRTRKPAAAKKPEAEAGGGDDEMKGFDFAAPSAFASSGGAPSVSVNPFLALGAEKSS